MVKEGAVWLRGAVALFLGSGSVAVSILLWGAEDLHKVDIWAEHNPVYQYLLAYTHLKAFGVENADKYSVLGIWNNF